MRTPVLVPATVAATFVALVGCSGTITDPLSDDPGSEGGDDPGDEDPGDDDEPDPTSPYDGEPIPLTLHINDPALVGETGIVTFGVPFPRGAVASLDGLVVTDAKGAELPSHVQESLSWREFDDGEAHSIRAARVAIEVLAESADPIALQLLLDAERTRELESMPAAGEDFVSFDRGDFPVPLDEPRVYAAFEPEWLAVCGLRGFTDQVGANQAFDWYDDFFVGAASTAANDLPEGMDHHIDITDNEPWLFDRTYTLFNVYLRTGDVRWLRHAHRSAAYYRGNLDDGYFQLAPNHSDLKYSYAQSLLVDLILTGDTRQLSEISDIGDAGMNWNETYTASSGFWTERHQAYALAAALSSWEASGDSSARDRLVEIATATFDGAKTPANASWPQAEGCVLHTIRSHEGDSDDDPVCSPWMGALLAEVVWRYYLASDDTRALEYLGGFGEFLAEHGLYDGTGGLDHKVPWYLVSSVRTYSDSGSWGDWEHSCDVAGALVRGAYALDVLGQENAAVASAANELLSSCRANLDYWHRPGSSLPEYRLTPARKFNWAFGTTSDMPWMADEIGL